MMKCDGCGAVQKNVRVREGKWNCRFCMTPNEYMELELAPMEMEYMPVNSNVAIDSIIRPEEDEFKEFVEVNDD